MPAIKNFIAISNVYILCYVGAPAGVRKIFRPCNYDDDDVEVRWWIALTVYCSVIIMKCFIAIFYFRIFREIFFSFFSLDIGREYKFRPVFRLINWTSLERNVILLYLIIKHKCKRQITLLYFCFVSYVIIIIVIYYK